MPSPWKGKGKARESRAVEGSGGEDGIVLPLSVTGSGLYDIAYTMEIRLSGSQQTLSVQVDTGSSDLWVTSTACTSSICKQAGSRQYNPSTSTPTGVDFSIEYLLGSVSGPIVWDRVEIGGYIIDTQALAAASSIDNEPISHDFNGLLGLALPLNSIIAEHIPAGTTDAPDGAAWASNLFSITPTQLAPKNRFLSLTLSRPGTDRIPALLGIGRHPSQIVSDPSLINYSTLVSEGAGVLFWKASVRAITVYADGQKLPVQIGRSSSGAPFPSAVLDSGVPIILTTSAVANGIYGAIGITPAADGQYYVPCNKPLNMTITLDNRPEIPLHPLDLTSQPPQDNSAKFCIGLIQTADAQLSNPSSDIGDMILGVPFLRNTYTVMAYTVPLKDGSFPIASPPSPVNTSSEESAAAAADAIIAASAVQIEPRLGLLGLTDPAQAIIEFNNVRVLNQPIDSNSTTNHGNGGAFSDDGKKLSVGIIVLIGLMGFFVLCLVAFGGRWFLTRRRYAKEKKARIAGAFGGDRSARGGDAAVAATVARGRGKGLEGDEEQEEKGYQLARRDSSPAVDKQDPTVLAAVQQGFIMEDTLRSLRSESFTNSTKNSGKERYSQASMSTTKTKVTGTDGEFGVRLLHKDVKKLHDDESATEGDDLGNWRSPNYHHLLHEDDGAIYHQRSASEIEDLDQQRNEGTFLPHSPSANAAMPLLPFPSIPPDDDRCDDDDHLRPQQPHQWQQRQPQPEQELQPQPQHRQSESYIDFEELGTIGEVGSMAGVGTAAARRSRMLDSRSTRFSAFSNGSTLASSAPHGSGHGAEVD